MNCQILRERADIFVVFRILATAWRNSFYLNEKGTISHIPADVTIAKKSQS